MEHIPGTKTQLALWRSRNKNVRSARYDVVVLSSVFLLKKNKNKKAVNCFPALHDKSEK